MFEAGKWYDKDAWLLRCPVCGDEYTHHAEVEVFERKVEDGPTIKLKPGSNVFAFTNDNPSDRRGAVRIRFWGECGHEWYLDIIRHKGNTWLVAERLWTFDEIDPDLLEKGGAKSSMLKSEDAVDDGEF